MMSRSLNLITFTSQNRILFIAVLLMAVSLASCRGLISEKPPIHPQQNMDSQNRFNAQEQNPFFEDSMAMRMPVEGTIARGQLNEDIGLHEGMNEDGDYIEENPMTLTREFLYRGQDRFNVFCSVCHGGTGDGQGIIMTGQYGYAPAPSFYDDRILQLSDGAIYSAIYNGINTMPSYKTQIPVEDRWAIVAYIRALQQSRNVPEDIIREYDIDIAALEEAYISEQQQMEEIEEEQTAGEEGEVSVERGSQLFSQNGCQACHSLDGSQMIGPSLAGIFGSERQFADGSATEADEDYLYESIAEPGAKIVEGYNNMMPPFSHLSDDEINSLIEFIKSLEDE